jgi:putative transposase
VSPDRPTKIVLRRSIESTQYACSEYTEILAAHDIRPSMSRIGNPYDNAKAESFMKTLKQEEINGSSYRNLSQARRALDAFIETVYNRQRLHSALAYRSPDEYEATLVGFPGVASPPEVSITEICY